jgi:hypothetical protein
VLAIGIGVQAVALALLLMATDIGWVARNLVLMFVVADVLCYAFFTKLRLATTLFRMCFYALPLWLTVVYGVVVNIVGVRH